MKIYPGTHDIIATNKIDTENDVQIAYITNQDLEYNLSLSTGFMKDSSEAVVPYETFDRHNIVLFDSNDNVITDSHNYLIRNGDNVYQYVPPNIVSTIKPDEFSYRVVGRRDEKYDPLKNYYLTVKCLNDTFDETDNTSLLDVIRSVFLYAADRKLCPNLIMFNDNDQNKFYYDQDDNEQIDFCFMKSRDGLTVTDPSNGSDIAIDSLPSTLNYTNLWIIVKDENFPNSNNPMQLYDYDGRDYDFKIDPILYDNIDYSSASLKLFLAQRYKEKYDTSIFTLSNSYYAPLYIKEDKVHKRFIIYSTESMFKNITTENANIIFEYIMQLYLMSYCLSDYYHTWIADDMPDYVVKNHKMIKQLNFVSGDTYYNLLDCDKDDVVFDTVLIDHDNISFSVNASDYIVFNKTQKDEQFDKPEDCMSIYCHNKTIIYYKDNVFVKTKNLTDSISYSYDGNRLTVSIDDFYDSYNGIYIPQNITTKIIPTSSIGNILIVTKDNLVSLLYESEYTEDAGIIIATIMFSKETVSDRVLYDIRLRGGGLPKTKQHDHQSILDIGSIHGVAYRRGGSIIIRLPSEFKKYDERIKNAVKKHIAADAYAFIIYN